ncbi:MAG: glycosyltransferase family 4 protein, partial [Candidatus Diapherotrites archaeon]|nr:glycosyltransferase family 4 protein [Candidatus Diapherotrites archaeon]
DVYHAHDAVMGFFSAIFLLRPLIYTAHGVGYKRKDFPFYVRAFLRLFETTTFLLANKVIAVDGVTAKEVHKYRKDVQIIRNGVTIEDYKKQKNPFKTKKLKILYVGRMIPSKGPDLLINAFKALDAKTRQKAELWVIGKGPELETLRSLTKEDKDIHLPGYVYSTVPYFAHSDVFVLSSLYEGFPFTLLEGMASKNACISTNISDLEQVFNEKEVVIIPAGNTQVIKNSLTNLINDPAKRKKLAENGFEKVKKDFNWSKIITEIGRTYKLF